MNPAISRKRRAEAAQARMGQHLGNGHHAHHEINVGDFERQASMIGGTVLAVYGLLRGNIAGIALAALGGALIWRGHTGHCEMYHVLGESTAEHSR